MEMYNIMKLYRLHYNESNNYRQGLIYAKRLTWYEICHHYLDLWDWGYMKSIKDNLEPL